MTTKRENILAAVKTALTGTAGVGTRIYRSRVEPMSRNESPAIIIEPVSDTPNKTPAFLLSTGPYVSESSLSSVLRFLTRQLMTPLKACTQD